MSENKYARAMMKAKEHVETHAEPIIPPPSVHVPAETTTRVQKPIRAKGRPPGKRSNPEWEQVTMFLRKDTKRAALLRLIEEQSNQDLSEVVEQLLAKWSK